MLIVRQDILKNVYEFFVPVVAGKRVGSVGLVPLDLSAVVVLKTNGKRNN
jgi:hypothetical protein